MLKWDKYFLDIAKSSATLSKDPSSKLGAISVRDQNILSTGFNGFPRKVLDLSERYDDRDTKLKFVVHAEMNCIFNAARNGVSLLGSTMYVDGIATCSDCAKGVIQSGVSTVKMRYKPMKSHWTEQFELTKTMFREAGVSFFCYEETPEETKLVLGYSSYENFSTVY
jgi:dCMP deaminase